MKKIRLTKFVLPLFMLSIGLFIGGQSSYLFPLSIDEPSAETLPVITHSIPPYISSVKNNAENDMAPKIQQIQSSSGAKSNLSVTDNTMSNSSSIHYYPSEFLGSISKTIEQNPELDLTAELLTRFEREDVDVAWAYQQELMVRNFFLDHPALADVSPNSIECKTNRCRIQLPLVNIEDGNDISMAISSAMASSSEFSKYSMAAGFNYERAVLEIYLPRNADVNLMQ